MTRIRPQERPEALEVAHDLATILSGSPGETLVLPAAETRQLPTRTPLDAEATAAPAARPPVSTRPCASARSHAPRWSGARSCCSPAAPCWWAS